MGSVDYGRGRGGANTQKTPLWKNAEGEAKDDVEFQAKKDPCRILKNTATGGGEGLCDVNGGFITT